jgi:hypothetical protein
MQCPATGDGDYCARSKSLDTVAGIKPREPPRVAAAHQAAESAGAAAEAEYRGAGPISPYNETCRRRRFQDCGLPGSLDLAGGLLMNPPGTGAGRFCCLGFFFSLLLRCWPLGMVVLLAGLRGG